MFQLTQGTATRAAKPKNVKCDQPLLPGMLPDRDYAGLAGQKEMFDTEEAIERVTERPRHLLAGTTTECGFGMREFYDRFDLIPTSPNADRALILSHVAYHSGHREADRVTITPSRGHSYRIRGGSWDSNVVVRIVDYYDHRAGVVGWC